MGGIFNSSCSRVASMAGWTRRKQNEESLEPTNSGISGHRQASHSSHSSHSTTLGTTTFELEDRLTNQGQEDPTHTSLDSAPSATENSTNAIDTNTSHIKRLRHCWSHNVRLNLEHGAPGGGDPRDFLALERTFLGWFRTSVALISFGVIITQLFVLKDVNPKKGKILGVIMACGGIIVILLGCIRYFEQQRLLVLGKAISGGWYHQLLIITLMLILITLFVMILVDG